MTSTPRRPGFRLPWSADTDEAVDAAASQPTGGTATDEPATAATAPVATPSGEGAAGSSPTGADGAPSASTPTTPAAPATPPAAAAEPFLQDLVSAMRRVAEEARDRNLSELRTLVEKRVEQVGARGAERAEDLRRRSELDIKGFADWEQAELARVRAEAERKVEARRSQLEQQLHDHQERTERDVSTVRERLAAHERELEAFFSQLAEIKDPSAFVVAAKRMPPPPAFDATPSADATPAAAPAPAATPQDGESLTSRLAMLGIDKEQAAVASNGTATASATAPEEASLQERLAQLDQQLHPTPEAAAGAPAAAPTAEAGGEVSTSIVVKGLGSFGAITSFKQSLEKAEGIRSVTLSLGPTGEFVYRVGHDAGFDVEAVIGSLEGGSAELERQADGTLRVMVNRPR